LKRIALIRRFYGPDGGAQRAVERMLRALGNSSFEVTLICESAPPDWQGRVIYVRTSGSRSKRLSSFVEDVQTILADEQFDLVQAHEWVPGADIYRLGDGIHRDWLDARDKARGSSQIRSWIERRFGFHKLMLRLQDQCILDPNKPAFICNSEMVANSLLANFPGTSISHVWVVRNIAERWAASARKSPREIIGFAGSGWDRKGLKRVIDALALLPNAQLVVAGKDANAKQYVKHAERIGVADRISFLGVLQDMTEFYDRISVLIHPATYDPFPNVTMEAMAQGLPCVVSAQTGTCDFAGHHAVTVSDCTPASLAGSINSVFDTYGRASESALSLAKQFDEAYLNNQLVALYDHCTKG